MFRRPTAGMTAAIVLLGSTWLLLWLPLSTRADEVNSLCGSGGCELLLGIGGTYRYWAKTGGIVVPFIFDWRDGRYELGAFRFTTRQMMEFHDSLPAYRFANPHWGFSLSRRWRLFGSPSVGVFLGLGASYKTETDYLDSTHWNFAEQLAVRWRISRAVGVELAIRHWSNAGLHLPNRGQNFATLTLVF